jgi:hypothetical protein
MTLRLPLEMKMPVKEASKVRKIAFVGDHLPRKCGIATFTSDLGAAVAAAYPESQCFCVSVNDVKGGYKKRSHRPLPYCAPAVLVDPAPLGSTQARNSL